MLVRGAPRACLRACIPLLGFLALVDRALFGACAPAWLETAASGGRRKAVSEWPRKASSGAAQFGRGTNHFRDGPPADTGDSRPHMPLSYRNAARANEADGADLSSAPREDFESGGPSPFSGYGDRRTGGYRGDTDDQTEFVSDATRLAAATERRHNQQTLEDLGEPFQVQHEERPHARHSFGGHGRQGESQPTGRPASTAGTVYPEHDVGEADEQELVGTQGLFDGMIMEPPQLPPREEVQEDEQPTSLRGRHPSDRPNAHKRAKNSLQAKPFQFPTHLPKLGENKPKANRLNISQIEPIKLGGSRGGNGLFSGGGLKLGDLSTLFDDAPDLFAQVFGGGFPGNASAGRLATMSTIHDVANRKQTNNSRRLGGHNFRQELEVGGEHVGSYPAAPVAPSPWLDLHVTDHAIRVASQAVQLQQEVDKTRARHRHGSPDPIEEALAAKYMAKKKQYHKNKRTMVSIHHSVKNLADPSRLHHALEAGAKPITVNTFN
eukprot:GHVT01061701.1.p1 GENE.GHVT01061701.1~~GHVT01061701.1.p1  ORF type:complete len:494 (+),score=77.46 GHVT01061701.1:739-2220(+)